MWFRDPWGMFEDPSIDGFFMDDGSRSERFSPLYANSGFFYLQSNPRVIHFMQTVLFSYDMIVQYASHQTIVIQVTSQTPMTERKLQVKSTRKLDEPPGLSPSALPSLSCAGAAGAHLAQCPQDPDPQGRRVRGRQSGACPNMTFFTPR